MELPKVYTCSGALYKSACRARAWEVIPDERACDRKITWNV